MEREMERKHTVNYSRMRRVGAHRIACGEYGGRGMRSNTRKADLESNGEQYERSTEHKIVQSDKGEFVVTASFQCN